MENAFALAIQSAHLLRKPHLLSFPLSLPLSSNAKIIRVRVRAETEEKDSPNAETPKESSVPGPDGKSSTGSGTGFGSSSPSSSSSSSKRVKKKRSRERATVTRRYPIEKPALFKESQPSDQQQQQQSLNESAFLLTWLGLGLVILVEGVALAASEVVTHCSNKHFKLK